MEMSMLGKILTSAMAVAMVLALPSVGDAAQKQKKKAKVRPAPVAQQHYGSYQRHYGSYQVPGSRTRAGTPCVTYTWEGCKGWDPDPHIRFMIDMDRGGDDK
jgi:hypothetical protein